jgi:hypothetical protein
MAVYGSTSIKEVIARVYRNTRFTDMSYIEDMKEWIPEAMGLLETKYQLVTRSLPLTIKNHCAKLPCHIRSMVVEKEGRRLPYGSTEVDYQNNPFQEDRRVETQNTFFSSDSSTHVTTQCDEDSYINLLRGQDLKKVVENIIPGEFYKIQNGFIQTSFEEGEVIVHYEAFPVDDEGYLLIPENEAYKQALFYYVLAHMILTGYEHKILSYNDCLYQFEQVYGPRATGEIMYPSVDRMERLRRSTVRLIPPDYFPGDFFTNAEQYQGIDK